MALFKAKRATEPEPQPEPQRVVANPRRPEKKDHATPTRREAEAARRQRLNPQLTPKEAKARERQLSAAERQKAYRAFDESPERQLMRDVVDSRFNLGEFAMPILLVMMALTFVPAIQQFALFSLYAMWAFIGLMVLDTFLMWRRYKRLAAERIPDRPIKGLLFYGFNRQLSFRRWRQPAPRVQRGEAI